MSENIIMKLVTLAHAASQPAASVPPAAVAALQFMGVQLSDWVLMLTALWIMVQIGCFVYDRMLVKHGRRREDRERDE